eukprot:6383290-Amphidinium_carterae.1
MGVEQRQGILHAQSCQFETSQSNFFRSQPRWHQEHDKMNKHMHLNSNSSTLMVPKEASALFAPQCWGQTTIKQPPPLKTPQTSPKSSLK